MMIMSSFDPLDLSSKNSECVSTLSTKQFLFHLAFIQVWEVQVPWIFTGAGAVSRHVVISWGCGFSETTFDLKTLLSWPFSTRDNLLANGRYGSRGTIFSDEPILALSKEIYNYIYIILWDSNILFHIISGTTYIYIFICIYIYYHEHQEDFRMAFVRAVAHFRQPVMMMMDRTLEPWINIWQEWIHIHQNKLVIHWSMTFSDAKHNVHIDITI